MQFAIDDLEIEVLEMRQELDVPGVTSTCTGPPNPNSCIAVSSTCVGPPPVKVPKLPPSYCMAV